MKIAIIVPVHNDLRVKYLLESFVKSELQSYKNVNFVFSLNAPTTELVELVKTCKDKYGLQIKSIITPLKGISQAKNNAIRLLANDYDFFCFVDSDCIVNASYIKNLVLYLEHNKNVEAFRGKTVFKSIDNNIFRKSSVAMRTHYYSNAKDVFFSPNIIYNTKVLKQVGLHNTLMKYGDDTEYSQRAMSLNFKVLYNPKIVSYHFEDLNFIKTLKTVEGYGYDRAFRLLRKYRHNDVSIVEKLRDFMVLHPRISKKELANPYFYLGILIQYPVSRFGLLRGLIDWNKTDDSVFDKFVSYKNRSRNIHIKSFRELG